MKRITPALIVIWSLVFLAGCVSACLGVVLQLMPLLFWLAALSLWLGDAVWITVVIVRSVRRTIKRSTSFVGNQAMFQRTLIETREAVSRYLSSVNRQGLLKRSAIHERPWFLLCGTPGSGKSSLLRGSGLSFPLRYPSEHDGAMIDGAGRVMWYFGNEAVWIDTPGSYLEENGKGEWQALVEALYKVRPERPVDGVALAVDVSEIMNTDDRGIKELALRLRGRIDDLIAHWNIEFPVYLLFNHTDEIPGFTEFFADLAEFGGDQVLGATIAQKDASSPARLTFSEEFNLLCKSLNEVRLDRLHKEPDAARKRMICRFVIHFQGVQHKLGVLVAELFKASNYIGKPLFRGFYFACCCSKPAVPGPAPNQVQPEVGATIANHPLNPHRSAYAKAGPLPASGGGVQELRSLFVLPLFKEIMVRDKPLVKATSRRSRSVMLRHYAALAGIGLAGLVMACYLVAGYVRINRFYGEVADSMARLPSENAPLMEQYLALDAMQRVMEKLQRYDDRTALQLGIGLYRGGRLLHAMKASYFYRVRRCMIAPAVKYLEYDIRSGAESFGELSGEDYDKLYRSLKAYLSISEAAMSHPRDIDTAFLRPVLFEGIRKSILASAASDRLPEKIENVLQKNMGLLCTYLRRGEFPVIQENQRLVAGARSRLRRLPSAQALYEGVMGQVSQSAAPILLDELIGRKDGGILFSSRTISSLYTQQGFDQAVVPALKEASKDPYKVDWVIGLTKKDVPAESIDNAELLNDMLGAYLTDFTKQWCAFLGSVEITPFVGLPQAARMLQKLVGEQSELQKLLDAAGKLTQLDNQSAAAKAGSSVLAAASRIKSAAAAAKAAQGAVKTLAPSLGVRTPYDDLNATFDPLRAFVASSGGALSGYAGYKEKVLVLVDKLGIVETGGDAKIAELFSGREDDPLYSAWKYTKSATGVMPEELSGGLSALLLRPLEMTGTVASTELARVFNTRWQGEIVKPFTGRFAGRYPFNPRGGDASWNDVMDFFRPSTGTFWGMYDRMLSSYVVKTSSGWMVRQMGGLTLNFNPALSATLTDAETIKNTFFTTDGTLRSFEMTVLPSASNKNSGTLEVDGQAAELTPSGKGVRIRWPLEVTGKSPGASLKIQVGRDFTQDISFSGPWGLMKLLSAAKVNKVSASTFTAKWQINVQNMYMIYFEARFQVAAADHPFGEPLFERFNCPVDLIVAGQAPSGQ